MTSPSEKDKPARTYVSGNPAKRHACTTQVQVPIGVEKLLYRAAEDEEFKTKLIENRRIALQESGLSLRSSEMTLLSAISAAAIEKMIDKIVPANPRRSKFMSMIATAAASFVVGTVESGCSVEMGISIDSGVDSDFDSGTSGDTDSDSETDTAPDEEEDTDSDKTIQNSTGLGAK